MNQDYYVIILDVIDSTKVKNRQLLTDQLTSSISFVNENYKEEYHSPFEITKGDEAAAVFIRIERGYELIRNLFDQMSPYLIRIVITHGRLLAGLASHKSTIIDGPAFQDANDLMIQCKKANHFFAINTNNNDLDSVIQSYMNSHLQLIQQFTAFQKETIRLYRREKNQKKVSEILGKKPQQIQNTLSRCRWDLIDESENALKILFQILEEKITQKRNK